MKWKPSLQNPQLALCWLLVTVTIVAAVGGGFEELFLGKMPAYSSTNALTGLTVVGLIWYTYFTWQSIHLNRSQFESRRTERLEAESQARTKLAIACMVELRSLADRTAKFVTLPSPPPTPKWFTHPVLDYACAHFYNFNDQSAKLLLSTRQVLGDLINDLHLQRPPMDCQLRAALAYEYIQLLGEQLRAVSGTMDVQPIDLPEVTAELGGRIPLTRNKFN